MKVIVIDSKISKVYEKEVDNDFKELQKVIGGLLATAAYLPSNDVVFVDDEGLLKGPESFFKIVGASFAPPLAGTGIVIGDDGEGGSINVHATVAEIEKQVTFLTLAEVRAKF